MGAGKNRARTGRTSSKDSNGGGNSGNSSKTDVNSGGGGGGGGSGGGKSRDDSPKKANSVSSSAIKRSRSESHVGNVTVEEHVAGVKDILSEYMRKRGPSGWLLPVAVTAVTCVLALWLLVAFNPSKLLPAWLLGTGKSHREVGYFAGAFVVVARDLADSNADYVLLGLDYHTSKWADFGGARDPGEVDPVLTACRELYEETAGHLSVAKTVSQCRHHANKCTVSHLENHIRTKGASVHQYVLAAPFDASLPSLWPPKQSVLDSIFFPHEKAELQWVKRSAFVAQLQSCCTEADDTKASTSTSPCQIDGLDLRASFFDSMCRLIQAHPHAFEPDHADESCFVTPQ